MYPMQTGQWVWMILIGHWEVAQHQAGKRDQRLTIQLEQLLVSYKGTFMLLLVKQDLILCW